MKFCKECKWFRGDNPTRYLPPAAESPKCTHLNALVNTDVVWGFKVYYAAKAMRHSRGACTMEGKWFEPIVAYTANTSTVETFSTGADKNVCY